MLNKEFVNSALKIEKENKANFHNSTRLIRDGKESRFVEMPNIDKTIVDLVKYIDYLEQENNGLQNILDNYSKDDKIMAYKERLKEIRLSALYLLSDKEKKREIDFIKKHHKSCGDNIDIKYIVGKTSIGRTLSICCAECKEKEDITDYDVW
jgi:hypothetical protein